MREHDEPQLRRLHAVYEHAPVGHVTTGMDSRIRSANRALATMLGYVKDDLVGLPIVQLVTDSSRAAVVDDAHTLRSGDITTVNATRYLRHRDGHTVPARICSALMPHEDPNQSEWMSIVVDLSEDETARADLERAHRTAVDAAARLQLLHGVARLASSLRPLCDVLAEAVDMTCEHLGEEAAGALIAWSDPEQPPVVKHIRRRGEARAGADVARSLEHLRPVDLPLGLNRIEMGPEGDRHATAVRLGDSGQFEFALVFRIENEPTEGHLELLSLVGIETSRAVEREYHQRTVVRSEERFRTVFSRSPLPMAITVNYSGRFDDANDALCTLLGRSAAELAQLSASDIVHPDDANKTDPAGAAALAAPSGRHAVELRLVHSSGAIVTTVTTLQFLRGEDGNVTLLAQMEDITARRRAEATLMSQARKDGLTDLANRPHLHAYLRHVAEAGLPCAVLFIDLDSFKSINDTRGHNVGDEVLVEVAARLRAAVRPSDLVARFGGDEFVVVAAGAPTDCMEATSRAIAARIDRSLAAPVETVVGQVNVSASVGIASGSLRPDEPDELVGRADKAMYKAKTDGRSRCVVYDQSMHHAILERRRAEASVRTALSDGRFVLHYQPLIDLSTLSVSGFEALVRLRDDSGELVPPGQFLDIVEQTGLMVPLGSWVLGEACRTVQALQSHLPDRRFSIAVNVSATQVAQPDFRDTVLATLEQSGLSAQSLALELTESALLTAERNTLDQLHAVRQHGIGIALDDFGTGYSSMTYLRTFPVTQLKIDRSFVSGVHDDGGDRAIVRAVAGLARDIGLTCVAEGVETIKHHQWVSEFGVDEAQGYLYSPPISAEHLLDTIAEFPTPRPDEPPVAFPTSRVGAGRRRPHPILAHRAAVNRAEAHAG